MPDYRVTLRGESREVYVITADTPEEARERWSEGDLYVSEASGMEVDSVEEDS